MPENEFEKKVSSELQSLKFKPSETVWMKVEERIKKKKRRRVFIILFLAAGIALLGYWQWDNFFGEKGTIVNNETPTQEKKNSVIENTQNIKEEKSSVNENSEGTKQEDSKPNNNKSTEIKKNENTKDNEQVKVTINDNSTIKTDSNISRPDILKKNIVDGKRTVSPVPGKRKNNKTNPPKNLAVTLTETDLTILTMDEPAIVKDSSKKNPTDNDVIQDTAQKTIIPNNKIDSIKVDTLVKKPDIKKDTVIKKIDTISKVIAIDSPVVNTPKKPSGKKWKFGIEFIPGYSSLHESFLSFNMNKSAADVYANPVGGSGSSSSRAEPGKSHSGFAFQFGGFFKKQFPKRSSLTLGLRWAYYSENLRVGAKMIPATQSPAFSQLLNALGATAAYDAGGLTYWAVNEYHFFEVPVNYNVQLNKNEAHPLNLQAGIKVGQMFTSNALVYDTAAGGIYYSSKKYFNKTQFGISTSLNWKITKKDKFYMAIGPVFDMHLNSLLDNPLDKKKYLMFIGLRTTVIFNSKNNSSQNKQNKN